MTPASLLEGARHWRQMTTGGSRTRKRAAGSPQTCLDRSRDPKASSSVHRCGRPGKGTPARALHARAFHGPSLLVCRNHPWQGSCE
eukprot:scaffold1541_cov256-Pinguiococcus_pyrenoidosus.AAC.29